MFERMIIISIHTLNQSKLFLSSVLLTTYLAERIGRLSGFTKIHGILLTYSIQTY